MPIVRIEVEGRQIILHQLGGLGCATPEDLVGSTTFADVVGLYVKTLRNETRRFWRRYRWTSTGLKDSLS